MFNLKGLVTASALIFVSISSSMASEWVLDDFNDYDELNLSAASNNGELFTEGFTTGEFTQDTEANTLGLLTASLQIVDGSSSERSGAQVYGTGDTLKLDNDTGVNSKLGLFYTNPAADISDPNDLLDLESKGSAFYFDILAIDTSFVMDLYVISDTTPFLTVPSTLLFLDDLYNSGTEIDTSAITSLTGGYSHKFIDVPSGFTTPGTITASFNSFTGDADFGAVTAIFAVITGATSADLEIDEVGIVSEPTTLAVFSLGLLALGAIRRRV